MVPRRRATDVVQKRSIRVTLALAAAGVAVLLLCVLSAIGIRDSIRSTNDVRTFSQRTNTALCLLRGDLNSRVVQSQNFLKTHPHGAFGISAAAILKSIHDQRQTIQALSILKCEVK